MKLLTREQLIFCLQMGVATLLAFQVTHGSDPSNAIYAVLGAALVTAPNVGEGLGVSRERLIGTLLGALVSLPAIWIRDATLSLIVTLIFVGPLGLLLGGMPVARIAVTVAAVTVILHGEKADAYGLLRLTNTVAGVAVAVGVSFVFWPLSARRNFSLTIQSALTASERLADEMARGESHEKLLDRQRAVFVALSAIPKAMSHMRLDPLLAGQRASLQKEARLIVKISIGILAISLVAERGNPAAAAETLRFQDCLREVAERIRSLSQVGRAGNNSMTGSAPLSGLAGQPGEEGWTLQIGEELRTIAWQLHELQMLLSSRLGKRA